MDEMRSARNLASKALKGWRHRIRGDRYGGWGDS
jgi:hypothetical protein